MIVDNYCSYTHSLWQYLNSPWISSEIKLLQDNRSRVLSVGEDVREVLGAEDVAQSGGGEQLGGAGGIADVAHCSHWILQEG